MKFENLFSLCFAVSCLAATSLATEPTAAGIVKLEQGMNELAEKFAAVQSANELTPAMALVADLQTQFENDKEIQTILSLHADNCPPELKDELERALKAKALLQDAAKALAMGGILSRGTEAEKYSQFFSLIKIEDSVEPELLTEGAPASAIANRDERMQWWRDGKFGMFIHYGLYSGLAGEIGGKKYPGCVEWIQQMSGADEDTYVKEALPRFNPKSGKAAEWVKLAKEAGCAYTVLTSRHHEGFNMWDTKGISDFNVVAKKGVDVIKEYSEACDKEGVKAGYYVSTIDWNHADYDPTGSGISYPAGNYTQAQDGKRKFGNHAAYKKYLEDIFSALVNNYRVDLVWWDFSQPNFQGDHAWNATRLMEILFKKYPMAIQNNRLYHSDNHLSEGGIKVTPHSKGDYSTAEHHVPATGIAGDWETCQTLNGTWGYSAENQQWKTSSQLIRELIDTVSRGGNYLLNIGPEPDGSIPVESIRLFKEIGAWMKVNGEGIYGTRANPLPVELTWGRLTHKGDDQTFIHVYERPADGIITIPCLFEGEVKATVLADGKSIKVTEDKDKKQSSFDLSGIEMNPSATTIKVVGKRIMP